MEKSTSALANSPNHCLGPLPAEIAEKLNSHLKAVDTVLYRPNETIERIYFPYSGIVSFVVGLTTGELVEAGVVGRNSAVGITAVLNDAIAINEAIFQVAMTAATIETGLLKELIDTNES